MSLDRTKLDVVRELGNGGWQARCPACAEAGQDRTGEHLRVSPEGKFGCCVFPGDREHRKRIFALAGDHGPKAIRVRVVAAKTGASVQVDLLGRLGRVFASAECRVKNSECETGGLAGEIGTLGTPVLNPRAYANEPVNDDLSIRKLIEFDQPVPSVPEEKDDKDGRDQKDSGRGMAYLTPSGDLVIPFDSPERFHWWTGGQAVKATLAELAGKETHA